MLLDVTLLFCLTLYLHCVFNMWAKTTYARYSNKFYCFQIVFTQIDLGNRLRPTLLHPPPGPHQGNIFYILCLDYSLLDLSSGVWLFVVKTHFLLNITSNKNRKQDIRADFFYRNTFDDRINLKFLVLYSYNSDASLHIWNGNETSYHCAKIP